MRSIKKLSTAIALLALLLVIGVTSVRADSSTPVNYVGVSITPITTLLSYNYDYLTGALTLGTATATALTLNNMFFTTTADPATSDPKSGGNGFGTFFGTARPVHFQSDEIVNTTSVCPGFPATTGPPSFTATCLIDGTLTFGGFVVVHNFNGPLDQVSVLASQYYLQNGTCGGGSPRFTLTTTAGVNHNIFVYFGPSNSFLPCGTGSWTNPDSGVNFANDLTEGGPRWDVSQLKTGSTAGFVSTATCDSQPFVTTYSGAVACANSLGLTIGAIFLVTDGAWQPTAGAPDGVQTVLFRSIQVNSVTRFP
jgi:hypothetical protein